MAIPSHLPYQGQFAQHCSLKLKGTEALPTEARDQNRVLECHLCWMHTQFPSFPWMRTSKTSPRDGSLYRRANLSDQRSVRLQQHSYQYECRGPDQEGLSYHSGGLQKLYGFYRSGQSKLDQTN